MRIQILHVAGIELRVAQCVDHGEPRTGAIFRRRSNVMSIAAHTKSRQLGVNACAAPLGVSEILHHEDAAALADHETVAIKHAFGDHAARLAVSSTKSMTGHLLGAAGVLEAILSVLAIRDQVAPPTTNYENPDPECDLDYVPNVARPMKIDVAVSNSFGFGGTNGTLVLRRFGG